MYCIRIVLVNIHEFLYDSLNTYVHTYNNIETYVDNNCVHKNMCIFSVTNCNNAAHIIFASFESNVI